MISLEYYRDLILVLTKKELQVRYKSSFLGYFWSLANPLFQGFIYFMCFKVVMKIQIENYTIFILSSLFPWQWFANSVNSSPMLFFNNARLIKKTPFPRETLIIAEVMQGMIHFVISIPVIVIFLFIYGKNPSIHWIYGVPIFALIQFLLITGIALALASINLFFRDLERLTTIFTMVLLFSTPIFFSETMVPPQYAFVLRLNPLASLIMNWRGLFMNGTIDALLLLESLISSIVIFMIGLKIYNKLRWRFAEVV